MLTFYEYRYYAREKARYPCFKLNTYHMRFFFETLSEAELAIQHRARHPDDTYQVLSFACEEIDHSTTIATFRPSLPVSPQRAKKLRNLYEQYKKEKNL